MRLNLRRWSDFEWNEWSPELQDRLVDMPLPRLRKVARLCKVEPQKHPCSLDYFERRFHLIDALSALDEEQVWKGFRKLWVEEHPELGIFFRT